MNDVLAERIRRKLEILSDEQAYQVLDYVEFLESRYAERELCALRDERIGEDLAAVTSLQI